MPLGNPFRKRRPPPNPVKVLLQDELDEVIKKLTLFSVRLRKELEVANNEENRLNPPKE